MSMHTGAAEAHAGDYQGYLTLPLVRRVMSAAYGGQTLLSNATAVLLSEQLPAGIALRDLGEHRLKGLLNPEHLWQIEQYAAVRLFVERASFALPTFALTDANAPVVAQICYRLDGIPLAIELAAARVKAMRVEQIAERLDDRFHLLTGGSRTALPRQQTLRSLVDWSHSLLSEPERVLPRRLSVFAGGWTLEAAEEAESSQVASSKEQRASDSSSDASRLAHATYGLCLVKIHQGDNICCKV